MIKKTPYNLFYYKYKNMDKDLIARRLKNNNLFFTIEKMEILESLLKLINNEKDVLSKIFSPELMVEMDITYLINLVLKEQNDDFLKNKRNIEYLIKEKISDIEFIFGIDITENIKSKNNLIKEIESNINIINKKMEESKDLVSFKESVKLKKELIYITSIILKINNDDENDKIKNDYIKEMLKSKNYYKIELKEDKEQSINNKEDNKKKNNLKNKNNITLKLKMKYFK